MKKSSGFTLLEVMIAVTIFALIASTLSKAASVTVDNQIHLERKLLATWIAENHIVELRSTPFDSIKKSKKDLSYAERKWLINTNVKIKKDFSGMPMPLQVKEIDVSVSLEEAPDNPLQTLTTFIAKDD